MILKIQKNLRSIIIYDSSNINFQPNIIKFVICFVALCSCKSIPLKPVVVLILTCIILSPRILFGTKITSYSTAHGLDNNNVYSSYVDRSGILWVGTETGLNYFDGKGFQPVDMKNNRFGVKGNPVVIQGICEDESGNVYFGTYDQGVYVFHTSSNQFQNFNIRNTPWIGSNQIFNVNYSGGMVHFATANGLVSYRSSVNQTCLSEDKTGGVKTIKCANRNYEIHETSIIEQTKATANTYKLNYEKDFFSDADILNDTLFCSAKCGVHLLTNNHFFKSQIFLNGRTISNDYFLGIGTINNRKYLLSYLDGVLWIDSIKNQTLYCSALDSQIDNDMNFTSVSKDERNKTLLVSTNKGIRIYELNEPAFTQLSLPQHLAASVMCIHPTKFGFYLGSQKGLIKIDTLESKISFKHQENSEEFVNVIYPYNNGFIIGSHSGLHFNSETSGFSSLPKELIPFKTFPIQGFLECGSKKVVFYDHHTSSLLFWYQAEERVEEIKIPILQGTLQSIINLSKNTLLLAGRGLFIFDLTSKKCTRLNDKRFQDLFFTDLISANHKIYASTFSSGIYILNPADADILQILNQENGLLSNAVYNLQPGRKGIWYSSSEGIGLLDSNTLQIQGYAPSEGFKHTNFDFRGSASAGNTIFFGQKDGLALINETNITKTRVKPNIIITQIGITSLNHFTSLHGSYHTLQLKHNENNLLLKLVSTDYLHPEYNSIFYRINQSSWLPVGKDHVLAFNELSPGCYQLEFSHHPYPDHSQQTPSLLITILPPWYQSTWFYIVMVFSAGILLFLVLRYYYRTRLKQQQLVIEKLQAVNQERQRISADIHDDMGGNVAAINMLSSSLLKAQQEEDRTLSFEELTYHSSQLSQKIKDVVWASKFENDTLESLILYIRQHITRQLDPLGFELQFTIPDQIPVLEMPGEKRKNIFYSVKEAVTNIIKHSGANLVTTTVQLVDHQIMIIIIDNGNGLKQKTEFGNGLLLMKKRLESYHGTVEISNSTEGGVRVCLCVPL